MFSRLLLLVVATAALPFPQLTEEEFLAPAASTRARSLDDPQDVFITSSYTQVGRTVGSNAGYIAGGSSLMGG